ncbi:MAG: hypothetical protein GXX96_21210 [Planctomycetaceae bacterium]|nr:hypothetical protein [Planctomycetaceae bacterium]
MTTQSRCRLNRRNILVRQGVEPVDVPVDLPIARSTGSPRPIRQSPVAVSITRAAASARRKTCESRWTIATWP